MANRCFGSVVRSLRLWNIDNASRHTSNEHHTSRRLSPDQMFCDCNGEKICTVDIYPPELLHPIWRITDSIKVLCKSSGCYESVNFAMLMQDFGNCDINRLVVGHICIMCCNSRRPSKGQNLFCKQYSCWKAFVLLRIRIIAFECFNKDVGLSRSIFFYVKFRVNIWYFLFERSFSLFRSTKAMSAPLLSSAWLITSPRPLAPPVTTATLPSREKVSSVRLGRRPLRPLLIAVACN